MNDSRGTYEISDCNLYLDLFMLLRAEDLLRKITSKRPAEGDTNEGIGKKAKTEDGGRYV